VVTFNASIRLWIEAFFIRSSWTKLTAKGGKSHLAISKSKKEDMVGQYDELLAKSKALIITQFGGMNMKELDKVRKSVREASAEYHVTKNTLALRALREKGFDVPEAWMTGSTAVAFCFNDAATVAKSLGDLGKDIDKLKVVGGVLDGKMIDGATVRAIASLPSLDVLRAQLLGVIAGPSSGIVGVLNAAVGGVMYALQAKIDKEQPAAA
jgi:large subunit ribosomal protein L10